MNPIDPCHTCEKDGVRVQRKRVDGEMTELRVCTNPACPMNTGEKSLADYV